MQHCIRLSHLSSHFALSIDHLGRSHDQNTKRGIPLLVKRSICGHTADTLGTSETSIKISITKYFKMGDKESSNHSRSLYKGLRQTEWAKRWGWNLFGVSLGTGAVSVAISSIPYAFNGQTALSESIIRIVVEYRRMMRATGYETLIL